MAIEPSLKRGLLASAGERSCPELAGYDPETLPRAVPLRSELCRAWRCSALPKLLPAGVSW